MAKPRVEYQCAACGTTFPKWSGQCAECGEWNTLMEIAARKPAKAQAPHPRFSGYAGSAGVRRMNDVALEAEPRTATQIDEFDRVLGGGLVHGSVVLIGGDPGIGKSTLLIQTLATLGRSLPSLYVTGEESLQQVTLRAHRLSLPRDHLRLLAETRVEQILSIVAEEHPRVLVIDSIQTLYSEQLQSAPGSVGQVRETAAQLVRYAKQTDTAVFLVGHVTKEGTLAGPRVLEHMVDTVLYFEGDPGSRYRVMRAVKNRFGAVNELGVFAMTERGLKAVSNPSAIFLSRHPEPVSGSVVMVTREGTRPLLVEVQALVDDSRQNTPKRITVGLEQNRLAMLLAVMHRHGGVALFDQDVFINVVGGVKVSETAADLAGLSAALSSLLNRPLASNLVVFGEVGLAGEIRPVPNGEERLREAAKHGYTQAIIPKANAPRRPPPGMEIHAVERLSQALEQLT